LLAPAELTAVGGAERGWRVRLSTPTGPVEVLAQVLIDAGGRSAPLAARLGARRQRLDRLVCSWIEGRDVNHAAIRHRSTAFLEATSEGWWYTGGIAGGRRLLAYHTDADLPSASTLRRPGPLVDAARHGTVGLGALLADTGFEPTTAHGFTAAHSASLRPSGGPGWLAAGDAALSFDPVSSQGLLNALVTGLASAEAVDRYLAGARDALQGYSRMLNTIEYSYRRNLVDCYSSITRWQTSPFWARRRPAVRGSS
jgi:flavin-dependent dehydrogenase